jgi:hypothetical protein
VGHPVGQVEGIPGSTDISKGTQPCVDSPNNSRVEENPGVLRESSWSVAHKDLRLAVHSPGDIGPAVSSQPRTQYTDIEVIGNETISGISVSEDTADIGDHGIIWHTFLSPVILKSEIE